MSALKDPQAPIRADVAAQFAPWRLPELGAAEALVVAHNEPAPEPAEVAPVIDEQELKALRDKAYQEGFAKGEREGFIQGEQKAQLEAKQALDKRLSSLQNLMQALFEPIAGQERQIESALLSLLQPLAREVIRRELRMDSSQILPLLREALSLLPMGADKLHLWVSAEDFETLKAFRDHHNEHWRICEDPDLLPGGFRLESEHSRIDASIESRLEQAFAQLAEQQREQALHPPEADMQIDLDVPSPPPALSRERARKTIPKAAITQDVAFPPRPLAGEGAGERVHRKEAAAEGTQETHAT